MYIMIHGSNLISTVVNKSYYYHKRGMLLGMIPLYVWECLRAAGEEKINLTQNILQSVEILPLCPP